jgi:hypothetical protein
MKKKKPKKNDLTTISEFPPEWIKKFRCEILHIKTPIMDGNKIRYVCLKCNKKKA